MSPNGSVIPWGVAHEEETTVAFPFTVRSTGYDSMKVVVKAKTTPRTGQEDRGLPNTKSWKVTG